MNLTRQGDGSVTAPGAVTGASPALDSDHAAAELSRWKDRAVEAERRASVAEAIAAERAAHIDTLTTSLRMLEAGVPSPPAPATADPAPDHDQVAVHQRTAKTTAFVAALGTAVAFLTLYARDMTAVPYLTAVLLPVTWLLAVLVVEVVLWFMGEKRSLALPLKGGLGVALLMAAVLGLAQWLVLTAA